MNDLGWLALAVTGALWYALSRLEAVLNKQAQILERIETMLYNRFNP